MGLRLRFLLPLALLLTGILVYPLVFAGWISCTTTN